MSGILEIANENSLNKLTAIDLMRISLFLALQDFYDLIRLNQCLPRRYKTMSTFQWRPFLEQYSRELLAFSDIRAKVSDDVIQSIWMGYEPAAAEDIDELESRIGAQLPDSYRQFLETSNGWRSSGGSIYEIFPTRKVQWFRTNNREWIDAYLEPAKEEPLLSIDEHCIYGDNQDPCRFRLEYLESTLQISEEGDSAVYLLNPEIKTFDGEWEAWFFANWLAGATRYPSFWDLLHAECRSVIAMREEESRRFHSEY